LPLVDVGKRASPERPFCRLRMLPKWNSIRVETQPEKLVSEIEKLPSPGRNLLLEATVSTAREDTYLAHFLQATRVKPSQKSFQGVSPRASVVRVPGQAHLMICREQTNRGGFEDVQFLMNPCRKAYEEAANYGRKPLRIRGSISSTGCRWIRERLSKNRNSRVARPEVLPKGVWRAARRFLILTRQMVLALPSAATARARQSLLIKRVEILLACLARHALVVSFVSFRAVPPCHTGLEAVAKPVKIDRFSAIPWQPALPPESHPPLPLRDNVVAAHEVDRFPLAETFSSRMTAAVSSQGGQLGAVGPPDAGKRLLRLRAASAAPLQRLTWAMPSLKSRASWISLPRKTWLFADA